jgi:hypothetical protein
MNRILLLVLVCLLSKEAVANDFLLNQNDTIVLDLNTAMYTQNAGVYYIDIPVRIHSTNTAINSFDFWFQFDTNKLTYVSTSNLTSGLDPFTFFNVNNQYLSNTSPGSSINFSCPLYTNLLMVRFSLQGACTEVYSSDFFNTNALVNGEVSVPLFKDAIIQPITIESGFPICIPSDVTFSYPSTYGGRIISNYFWDFNPIGTSTLQGPVFNLTQDGTFPITLDITTEQGCTYQLFNEITAYPAPLVSFTSSFDEISNLVSFTNLSTIPSGNIITWDWDFGDATFSSLFEPTHTYPAPNTYSATLTATSDFGCTASFTDFVYAIGIEEIEIEELTIELFPNPAINELHITSNFNGSCAIYDAVGNVVFENILIYNGQNLNLNISNLAQGSYVIKALSEYHEVNSSFLVTR